jgi:hypothetical protein
MQHNQLCNMVIQKKIEKSLIQKNLLTSPYSRRQAAPETLENLFK